MAISVVVPARNAAATLAAQLDALLAQLDDVDDAEVVVVDDGSTDGTAAVIAAAAGRDRRLRTVAHPGPHGAAHARNAGARAAHHDTVACCDADDVVAPGWLSAVDAGLRRHRFVSGPLDLHALNPRWLATSRGASDASAHPTFHGLFPRALGANFGIHRPTLDMLGWLDQRFAPTEDIELSARAWRAGVELAWLPGAIVRYRYRPEPLALYRQGWGYGVGRARLCRALADAGGPTPPPLAGWRSWLWLAAQVPAAVTPRGRARLAWAAGNRFGQVAGSLRYRVVYL